MTTLASSEKLFEEADEFDLELIEEEEPERVNSRWLGFPGVALGIIAAREAVLGLRLPDDYRAFLHASNGFRGMAGLPYLLCSLLPVEEIGWMRDKDERIGRLSGFLEDSRKGLNQSEDFAVDPEDFARTLLIGESDGNECILLLPPQASSSWELWTYHPEVGFETGGTFEDFMESALEC